jgi:hypothetical protein
MPKAPNKRAHAAQVLAVLHGQRDELVSAVYPRREEDWSALRDAQLQRLDELLALVRPMALPKATEKVRRTCHLEGQQLLLFKEPFNSATEEV